MWGLDYELKRKDGIHVYVLKFHYRGRYNPHQGRKECQRRQDQIKLGKLRGSETFIPTAARFAASGLHYV